MRTYLRAGAAVLSVCTGLGWLAATGAATASPVKRAPNAATHTIAKGFVAPFGLYGGAKNRFLVADAATGQVVRVLATGKTTPVFGGADGVAGVAAYGGKDFAVTGGGDEVQSPPAGHYAGSTVLRATQDGKHVTPIADLLDYELKHNPDGQKQFDSDHNPYDALSNPFSLTSSRDGLYVADGGANDVLRVSPTTGKISTYFVPPNVTDVPACQGSDANSNPGAVGCDSVPTGVAVTAKSVYVSTLGGERPGAGRVYRLSRATGKVLKVIKGLTAPTGIAVEPDGTIFLSEVGHNAPESETPPAGFDSATVGRITRIKDGHKTYADVTQPTGLVLRDGHLFASTWSTEAIIFGGQPNGRVVRVNQSAFLSPPS